MQKSIGRLPWVTATIVAAALGVSLLPGGWFGLVPEAVAAGQWWRLATGHLVHWTGQHLFWDLLAFVVLGTVTEWRSRWAMVTTLLLAGGLINGWLMIAGTVQDYRGLSGIDSALFVLAAMQVVRDQPVLGKAALTLFVGKTLYELATGSVLFAGDLAGAAPLVEVHLLGAIAASVHARSCFATKETVPCGAWRAS